MAFVGLMTFMRNRTKSTTDDVSQIYMSEINIQLQGKFTSIISLRLEQVKGIIERTPVDTFHYTDKMLNELIASAGIGHFTYLGFCTDEGNIEMFYWKKLKDISSEDIITSLNENGNIIEQYVNEEGDIILLLGRSVQYEMKNGKKSVALIAGISMEYLNEALFLENENSDSQVYTHIIGEDGRYCEYHTATSKAWKSVF